MSLLLPEVIVLSNEAELLARDPAPDCDVEVTTVRWQPAIAAGEDASSALVVRGVAWGASKVQIGVLVNGSETTVDAEVESNRWEATVSIAGEAITPGAAVRLEARSVAPTDCAASDKAVVTLGVTDRPYVEPGAEGGFDARRTQLLAGQPSRVVESRVFSALADVGLIAHLPKGLFQQLNVYHAKPQTKAMLPAGTWRVSDRVGLAFGEPVGFELTHRVDFDGYVRKFSAELKAGADGATSAGSTREVRAIEHAALKAALRAVGDDVAGRIAAPLAGPAGAAARGAEAGGTGISSASSSTSDTGAAPANAMMTPSIVIATLVPSGDSGIESVVLDILLALELLLKTIAKIDYLGVLFYDEIHFRPIGLVPGEPIYQLSLAPGEEVVLTEEHSSKRSSSLEDIRDRESEANLEFESSWTTDVTQTLADELQAKIGGNLGGEVTIPKTPITANAGIDPELAAQNSKDFVVKLVNEVSRKMAAKMREQHKTTVSVSTELAATRGTQRTIWNPNPSRVLDLTYYKLYRKERLTLERHDAKLCLAVYVEDPTNAELYNCAPPAPSEVKRQQLTLADFGIWEPFSRLVGFLFDYDEIVLTPSDASADLVLASASVKVVKWVTEHFDGHQEEHDGNAYVNAGGNVYFGGPIRPVRLDSPGKPGYEIHVEAPLSMTPFAWVTKRVVVQIESVWMPEPTSSSGYSACIQAEQARLRDAFSADRVVALADRVHSLASKLVFARLIDEYLLAVDPLQGQASLEQMDQVRSLFDWNEAVVEYLPWWLTPYSREKYQEIRAALKRLPGDFSIDDVIGDEVVSARAKVYLPIKPGAEKQALELIGKSNETMEEIVRRFDSFRERRFGVIDRSLPTYEEISSPRPMLGTPHGADDWVNDWERPARKFEVLGDWYELFPTDAIHAEPSLSAGTATDEVRTADLRTRRDDVDLKK